MKTLYDRWQALGSFIGKHLILLIPLCLALGIIFPEQLSPIRVIVPTIFAIMTFQSALTVNLQSLKDAITHPGIIVLALVFSHVASPLLAFWLGGLFFGDDPDIMTGIVLEYSVPMATTAVMWVSMYKGNVAVVLTTLFFSILISPITIPATLSLLLGSTVHISLLGMALDMVYMVVVPAIAALAANECTHGWAARKLSPALAPLSRVILLTIVASNTTTIAYYVRNLTPELGEVVVFIGLYAIFNFAMGIALGLITNQKRDRFICLTFETGMRNISAGAVLAVQYFGPASVFPVMAGTFFQQLLGAAFGKVMERVLARMDGAAET